ncbi:hypothetical protein [Agrobacterium rosae]|uniref:hypothetical protein n=1 Tax=Agrobacterium rosae TaxID=1972867 RepID=UPI00122EC90B|nr:hypothetical protein [Agrobacterium rosae]KAA3510104.1 hypothetical protein DXM21_19940 [Agrobacterium rosae]KAA3514951.1 hypothetical protein DXM25_20430 [Agrobacterium rosae]MQB50724.1 hypothetical protein [Agrobacterium rosae]
MTDLYRPVKGQRIPMPGNAPDWPADGRPINHSSAYEARLLAEGSLEKVPEEPQKSGVAEKVK